MLDLEQINLIGLITSTVRPDSLIKTDTTQLLRIPTESDKIQWNPTDSGQNPTDSERNPTSSGWNPRYFGRNPRYVGCNPRYFGRNPRYFGRNPRYFSPPQSSIVLSLQSSVFSAPQTFVLLGLKSPLVRVYSAP